MEQKSNGTLREALAFDDVLLKPGLSELLPSDADIRTRITRDIPLNIPIIASAMDTVTEAKMAIAMAQAGGLGVIHRNLEPEEQAAQVRQVKKFESGMVVNPVTINPGATLAEALALMQDHRISGIPVVEGGGDGRAGKLVGILTNRDVRFATDPRQTVAALMTKERLITVREGVGQDEAKRLLHQHRIEKPLVVDAQYRCVGLITVKDIEKAVANPNACKDEQGRLRVAAATTVGDKGYERTERLIEAGVDLVVVDTAHGHSQHVLNAVNRIKRVSNKVQVVAGNVATTEGAQALIDAGADSIKVGIGPGSICTTRMVAGVGVPQLTAIMDAVEAAKKSNIPVIADGGLRHSGARPPRKPRARRDHHAREPEFPEPGVNVAAGKRVLLAARPVGEPKESDFRIEEMPVPTAGPGQMLLRTLWLSLDPYMRGRMSDAPSYATPVAIGQVMEGRTVSEVVASSLDGFAKGDIVFSPNGWQTHAC